MLVVIPDSLYGRIGAVLSALIFVFCVIGLTMHKKFYDGRPRKGFFCFYTNLSNLLVGVYFSLLAPQLYARASLHSVIPHVEFALMLSILLTFSVFHLLLYPAVRTVVRSAAHTREFRIVCTDNFIVHYLVPWLVFFYWLLCSPGKATLGPADILLWTLFPIIYLILTEIRASKGKIIEETDSPYPYPFLDTAALGKKAVLRTCTLMYGVCTCVSFTIVLAVRLAFALLGGNHSLILI